MSNWLWLHLLSAESKSKCCASLSCLCFCPTPASCWYKPFALPRQPVVFYDETRWDLEKDLRRGGKGDGFFFPSDTRDENYNIRLSFQRKNLRDMTTNAVLLTVMHSVCPFCAISVMILSLISWLVSSVVYKWIKSVFLFFLLAVPVFFRLHFILFFFFFTSAFMPVRSLKNTL